ncbi:hypothetical protein ACTMP8_24515, partial [Escherichia coli]|uniref:hypothetical protein n=1 Tax=Escherichia coli TaxID=562 RepID=UPI003F8BF60D
AYPARASLGTQHARNPPFHLRPDARPHGVGLVRSPPSSPLAHSLAGNRTRLGIVLYDAFAWVWTTLTA